jgi:hypothetical protein
MAAGATAFGLLDLTVWNAPPITTAIGGYVVLFIVVGAPGVVMESRLRTVLQLAAGDVPTARLARAVPVLPPRQRRLTSASGPLAGPAHYAVRQPHGRELVDGLARQ